MSVRRQLLLVLAVLLTLTAVSLTYAQVLIPNGLFHEHVRNDPRATGLLFFTWLLVVGSWVVFGSNE